MFNYIECEDIGALKKELSEHGVSILKTCMPESVCGQIKKFIDDFPEDIAEINYGGTEKRIWSAQEHFSQIDNFSLFADKLLSTIFGKKVITKTVLAYRNLPIQSEPELTNGRWHLDSLKSQYKVFCFLTNTTENSGPLELVPGTHYSSFKVWPLLSGHLIRPWDLGTGRRHYQKLDDTWVQRQAKRQGGTTPLLCEAGSVFIVNTSAIHRARPCFQDNRYALSVYYDHF